MISCFVGGWGEGLGSRVGLGSLGSVQMLRFSLFVLNRGGGAGLPLPAPWGPPEGLGRVGGGTGGEGQGWKDQTDRPAGMSPSGRTPSAWVPAPPACPGRYTGSDPWGRAGHSDGGAGREDTAQSPDLRFWLQNQGQLPPSLELELGLRSPGGRTPRARASRAWDPWTGVGGGEQPVHYETPGAGQCLSCGG